MEGRYLNLEEAYSICRVDQPTGEFDDYLDLDLSAYAQADPDALKLLATQGWRAGVILGLTSLTIENAAVIANWGVITRFIDLAHLSREVAVVLSKIQAPLSFDGLSEIDAGVSSELANVQDHLCISLLESLSMESARELSKHQRSLRLTVAVEPPMDVQRTILYGHQGFEITLYFPINGELIANYMYCNWNKEIEISSGVDSFGITWLHVNARVKFEDELEESESSGESDE